MAENFAGQSSVKPPTNNGLSDWCKAKLARYWTHLACFVAGAILSWGGTTVWDGFAVFYLDLTGGPHALFRTVDQLAELRLGEQDKMIARLEDRLDRQILEYPGIEESLQTWCPIFNPPLSLKVAAELYDKNRDRLTPHPMMLAAEYRKHYPRQGEFAKEARECLKSYPIDAGYAHAYLGNSESAVARLARAEKFGATTAK